MNQQQKAAPGAVLSRVLGYMLHYYKFGAYTIQVQQCKKEVDS